jgi:hypothetical protein
MEIALLILVAVFVLLALAFMATRRKRSEELREQFGSEYDQTVRQMGGRREAESELEARRKRVDQLDIHELSSEDQKRFADSWRATQVRFVDEPSEAIVMADRLVGELMQARGYPVGRFEQRAADISVDHPNVVTNYRAAHNIALDNERGGADTEELRQAMVHYRLLFEELLEARIGTDPATVNRSDHEEDYRARAS